MAEPVDKRAKGGIAYPSGSSIGYLRNCIGRHQAQQNFPDKDDNDANLGTEIHWHLSEETAEDDLPDHVEFAVTTARKMTEQLRQEFQVNGNVVREKRIWLEEKGEPKFSGEIDFFEVSEDQTIASIIDYKTLFGYHAPAEINRQLQIYSVLLLEEYPKLQKVYLGLVQPMLGKVTKASLDVKSIKILRENLIKLIDEAMGENPKRTAGADQCRWCKALAHCPEAYEYIKKNTQDEIEMEAIGNEELSEKMGFAPLLERFIKEIKDLVRARLEKDIEVPDFKLRSTGKITTYNPVEASKILFDANLSIEEFLGCCSIKEPALIKAWQKYTGLPAKKAKEDLRTRLENAISQKEKSKSISRV
jgi:hypothetical protein